MKADLSVIGPSACFSRHLVAGGTGIQVGEPVHSVATLSSGVSSANTHVLAAADTPVIGTHRFGGIAMENSLNAAAGTVLAQKLATANPVPYVGIIRGKAETLASIDTYAELVLLVQDVVLIDYNSTGGSDGGELYTIKEAASADTSGLEILDGDSAAGTLDVTVDARAYRSDVS